MHLIINIYIFPSKTFIVNTWRNIDDNKKANQC